MYHYLTGKLVEKAATNVVMDVNGIGYQLQVPLSTFGALPELGQPLRLLTHFAVREDAQVLYGFLTEEERQLFRLLISVSGIGPKSALTMLSGVPVPELKRAIIDGNLVLLTAVPGIGKKTAERIVVELREKVFVEEHRAGLPRSAAPEDAVVEDSLRALIELGYRRQNAQDAIQKALRMLSKEALSVPDLIRTSLKYV